MKGFFLFLVAIILYIPLTFLNIIAVMFKYGIGSLAGYFYQTAIDIDRFGNRNLRTLLNTTLIKSNGYQFGDYRETISSVMGKNKVQGTLSLTGLIICRIIHIFDHNHCIKSIHQNL